MHSVTKTLALLAWATASAAVGITVGPAAPPAARAAPAHDAPTAEIAWEDSVEAGMARAAGEGRPVFLYLTMPGCPVCRKLERTTFADPAVRQRLREWLCIRANVAADRALAAQMGVEATPTLVLMASDGRPLTRIAGFVAPVGLLNALASGVETAGGADPEAVKRGLEALALVKSGSVDQARWPDVLMALGTVRDRKALTGGILALDPFPRTNLVGQLAHPQLAVRLGALEVLEQAAGDDFGFDPWTPPAGEPGPALARWQAWAADTQRVVTARFATLTEAQVRERLLDLLSADRDRVQRARRLLLEAGSAVSAPAGEFLARHRDLPQGLVDRVREVRYASMLPAGPGFDPAVQAQRLVFGNLDLQLQALRDLRSRKAAAIPVATEFLQHPNPLVRETAVETLVATARRDAVPVLRDLLKAEPNREVIVAAARGLGSLKGKAAGDALAELLDRDDEDIVIVALRGLSKNDNGAPAKAIAGRLGDARWRVRVAALQAARELQLREAADDVERLLNDDDAFVRFTAIVTLPKVMNQDRAARRLERAFGRDDDKGAVIAAFGEMDRALPSAFTAACAGKPAEVLLPVLDALRKCGKYGVPLATALATHPDGDVACAALTVLAQQSARSASAPVLAALQRGGRGQVLAVLASLRTEERESRSYRSSDESAFDDMLAQLSDTRAADGGGAAGASPMAELLDAFLAPASNAPPAAAAPAVAIRDLFDAFDATQAVSQATDAAAPEAAPASSRDLTGAIRAARGRFPNDPAIHHAALMALLRLGDTSVLPEVAARIDGMSDTDRAAAAGVLNDTASVEALDMLRRLLRDDQASVRRSAVAALCRHLQRADWCDALFQELTRAGTPLKPVEAGDTVMGTDLKNGTASANVRGWSERLMALPPGTPLQILGIALYEKAGRRTDAPRLAALAASEHVLVRRAALRSAAMLDANARAEWLGRAAGDPAEDVRGVVPAVLANGSGNWVTKLGPELSFSTWQWSSRDRRLKDGERQVLHRLASDPVADLRAQALIALMSAGEAFEAADLMSAIEQSRDSSGLGWRAASALESSYEKLNERYAALLPLLDMGRISEDRRTAIVRRLSGPPGKAETVLPLALKPAAPVAVAAQTAAPPAAVSAATNAMRVVFFHAIGCEECEATRGFLGALKDAFPEMRVEEYEMGKETSRALNEALCERFHVPEAQRGRTPTVVAGAGYLVGHELTFDALSDLLARSLGTPLADGPPPAH